jgi:hypothetical protein
VPSLLAMVTDNLLTLAGLAWDPHYRGALTVVTAVVILCGSIYLILSTNMGARLGLLVSLGGLFGWMAILGLTWWITAPAIGPRGTNPEWQTIEIVYGDTGAAANEETALLPNGCFSTVSPNCEQLSDETTLADQVIADNPEIEEELNSVLLSEVAVVDPTSLEGVDFGGWHVVSNADAGEAQAVAGAALTEQGVFADPTEYKILDSFEIGGKDERDGDGIVDRVLYKISSATQLRHPTHYAIVQVQKVVPEPTIPGEPPPLLEPDPNAPVISVVMIRDLGNVRVPGAMVTIGSTILLFVTAYALHRRDKLSDEHRAEATTGAG